MPHLSPARPVPHLYIAYHLFTSAKRSKKTKHFLLAINFTEWRISRTTFLLKLELQKRSGDSVGGAYEIVDENSSTRLSEDFVMFQKVD